MKNPLSKFVIAVTGDFGEARTCENLKRWIEGNGGTYATSITTETTHLIASEQHWKKKAKLVQDAKKFKNVKVVKYDWLEDSLMNSARRREGPYTWKKVAKVQKKVKIEKKRKAKVVVEKEEKKFDEGCKKAQQDLLSDHLNRKYGTSSTSKPKSKLKSKSKPTPTPKPKLTPVVTSRNRQPSCETKANVDGDMNLDNYHVYQDDTGFDYDVALTRVDVANNSNERYLLRLYESHTFPHTFATVARYHATNREPTLAVLAAKGSSFYDAFKSFCRLFHAKTKVKWDQRLNATARALALPPPVMRTLTPTLPPTPESDNGGKKAAKPRKRKGKKDDSREPSPVLVEEEAPVTARPFVYQIPLKGDPIGMLPGVSGARISVAFGDAGDGAPFNI